MPALVEVPVGTRGFDCNVAVGAGSARLLARAGYRFAVRYVRRTTARANDLSPTEVELLHGAGIAVMPVQHVESESAWAPSPTKGVAYGAAAVDGAQRAGMPPGVTVWLDLEGVAVGTPAAEVIGYCNAWHGQVAAAGYLPGLYVGWRAGLNAGQLYSNLRFDRYWAAYNLNRDQYPAVRGACMRQGIPTAGEKPVGLAFDIDTDIITGDALGGVPVVYAPDEWGMFPAASDEAPGGATGDVEPSPSGGADLYVLGTLVVAGLAAALYWRFRR